MQVVRHDHVRADPRPVFRTSTGKIEKSFVNACSGKNFSPLVRTSCDEIIGEWTNTRFNRCKRGLRFSALTERRYSSWLISASLDRGAASAQCKVSAAGSGGCDRVAR